MKEQLGTEGLDISAKSVKGSHSMSLNSKGTFGGSVWFQACWFSTYGSHRLDCFQILLASQQRANDALSSLALELVVLTHHYSPGPSTEHSTKEVPYKWLRNEWMSDGMHVSGWINAENIGATGVGLWQTRAGNLKGPAQKSHSHYNFQS